MLRQLNRVLSAEVYLEPCQTYEMVLFAKNIKRLSFVNYFFKKIFLDIDRVMNTPLNSVTAPQEHVISNKIFSPLNHFFYISPGICL